MHHTFTHRWNHWPQMCMWHYVYTELTKLLWLSCGNLTVCLLACMIISLLLYSSVGFCLCCSLTKSTGINQNTILLVYIILLERKLHFSSLIAIMHSLKENKWISHIQPTQHSYATGLILSKVLIWWTQYADPSHIKFPFSCPTSTTENVYSTIPIIPFPIY